MREISDGYERCVRMEVFGNNRCILFEAAALAASFIKSAFIKSMVLYLNS